MSSAAIENLRRRKAEIEAQLCEEEAKELEKLQSKVSTKINAISDTQKITFCL